MLEPTDSIQGLMYLAQVINYTLLFIAGLVGVLVWKGEL